MVRYMCLMFFNYLRLIRTIPISWNFQFKFSNTTFHSFIRFTIFTIFIYLCCKMRFKFLSLLPIITPSGQRVTLGDVAKVYVEDGPPGIKSENARLNGWAFIDIDGVDIGSYVKNAQAAVNEKLKLPAGYSIGWSGQYEYIERAKAKLMYVVPLTLMIIIILLYINFRNFVEVAIIMGTLPLAMVGSIWLMYIQGYNFSVAVAVGFIALAGVAVEIGVIMLVYLNQAYNEMIEKCAAQSILPREETLRHAVLHGAGMRVRPVMMTATAIIAGLLPILYGTGTGSEVMGRIAAPMVGGMISAVILTLLVVPAIYFIWKRNDINKAQKECELNLNKE